MRSMMALLVFLSLLSAASAADNLIRNPGFDNGLDPWTATGTAQCVQVSDWHTRSPCCSFGIGNDEGPPGASATLTQAIELPQPLLADTEYACVIWAMPEANCEAEVTLTVQCLNVRGEVLGEHSVPGTTHNRGQWRPIWLGSSAPGGTKMLRLTCACVGMPPGEGLSFIWFDDASLTLE